MPLVVAFVKDGDVQLWDEVTQQNETIFSAGDAIAVWMSDDGQVIAFLRRWIEQIDDQECWRSALWMVEWNGENARELVSAERLRQHLGVTECESPSIIMAQVEWLPQTQRLVYSLIWDNSHALPQGVYLVDTESLSDTALVSADNYVRFVPSPDGQQIALMSTNRLSFINVDGSNWCQDVLTYARVGVLTPLLSNGVWTQDSPAFLIAAPIESESEFVLNYTIMRVPVDGSTAQPLATIADSHGDSVAFSPDGQHAAFLQPAGIFITTLAADVGPLAIPYAIDLNGYADLYWSPAGAAFILSDKSTGTLFQLCADTAQGSEVCGDPVNLGGFVAAIHWVDSTHFLLMKHDPATLSLGTLDGTTTPIVTWSPEEWAGPWSFSIAER